MKKQDIDEIDLKILAILQDNAAITNKDLATEIGLSAPPTLARVNALKDKGAIKKYIIQIDYAYLKLSVHKLVAVKIKKDDLQKALILWKSLPWLSGFTVTKPNVLTGNIWIYGQFCVPSEEVFKTVTDQIADGTQIIDMNIEDVYETEDVNNTLASPEKILVKKGYVRKKKL